jgi:predicted alpha/beta hydrolase
MGLREWVSTFRSYVGTMPGGMLEVSKVVYKSFANRMNMKGFHTLTFVLFCFVI